MFSKKLFITTMLIIACCTSTSYAACMMVKFNVPPKTMQVGCPCCGYVHSANGRPHIKQRIDVPEDGHRIHRQFNLRYHVMKGQR